MAIEEVLELHRQWLAGNSGGVSADLRVANLREDELEAAVNEKHKCPVYLAMIAMLRAWKYE